MTTGDRQRVQVTTVGAEPDDEDRTAILCVAEGSPGEARGLVTSLGPGPDGSRRLEVVVDGWRFEFLVEDADRAELRARASRARVDAGQDGPTEVRAAIPGRIVEVRVVAGDAVERGRPVAVVEAMKMQNEVRAPRDGAVARVAVGAGETVEVGDLLVVIE
jgi:biotin carboxyl carrier protein